MRTTLPWPAPFHAALSPSLYPHYAQSCSGRCLATRSAQSSRSMITEPPLIDEDYGRPGATVVVRSQGVAVSAVVGMTSISPAPAEQ